MRFFFRKQKQPLFPPPPGELTQALNRWIDQYKHRIAVALGRHEQRLSVRQKKWVLVLFCGMAAAGFLLNAYEGLVGHHSTVVPNLEQMTLPSNLPPPVAGRPADSIPPKKFNDSLH